MLTARTDWRPVATDRQALQTLAFQDDAVTAALPALGLGAAVTLIVARHDFGDWGLPIARHPRAFVLDLNEDWPSPWGGLLLFGEEGRLAGWRPEPGAATVFDGDRPPLLTMITARTPRLCLLGGFA